MIPRSPLPAAPAHVWWSPGLPVSLSYSAPKWSCACRGTAGTGIVLRDLIYGWRVLAVGHVRAWGLDCRLGEVCVSPRAGIRWSSSGKGSPSQRTWFDSAHILLHAHHESLCLVTFPVTAELAWPRPIWRESKAFVGEQNFLLPP